MPCIDFTEIPAAHVVSGEQDCFELFARDFFEQVFEFKFYPNLVEAQMEGKIFFLSNNR